MDVSPSFRTGVILPAAGSGIRFGGDEKKQFRLLDGQPLVVATAKLFIDLASVSEIVVVVPGSEIDKTRELFSAVDFPVQIVAGGATRNASVRLGFAALGAVDLVLIHDAVRPFTSLPKILEVLNVAHTFGAAALATGVTDTLRKVDRGILRATIDRVDVVQMQTPQVFSKTVLARALELSADDSATDEVMLVQNSGTDVWFVQGEATNIKITKASDWALGLAILEGRRKE